MIDNILLINRTIKALEEEAKEEVRQMEAVNMNQLCDIVEKLTPDYTDEERRDLTIQVMDAIIDKTQ